MLEKKSLNTLRTLFFRTMHYDAPNGVMDFSENKSNPVDIF